MNLIRVMYTGIDLALYTQFKACILAADASRACFQKECECDMLSRRQRYPSEFYALCKAACALTAASAAVRAAGVVSGSRNTRVGFTNACRVAALACHLTQGACAIYAYRNSVVQRGQFLFVFAKVQECVYLWRLVHSAHRFARRAFATRKQGVDATFATLKFAVAVRALLAAGVLALANALLNLQVTRGDWWCVSASLISSLRILVGKARAVVQRDIPPSCAKRIVVFCE